MKAQELFLKKIQGDETFAKKVFDLNSSKEDVQLIAKEAGIEISFEELEELKEQFIKASARQEGELSDDDLDAVAGGGIIGTVLSTIEISIEIGFGKGGGPGRDLGGGPGKDLGGLPGTDLGPVIGPSIPGW